jgi:hypothetical protein
MAEERIDIKVTDGVDANVAKKMVQIADGADRASSALDRLKAALNAANTTALDRLASAMAKVDSAQARLIGAQARLTNAQNAGSVAAQRAALAQQKVATEAARTEAAQARAAAATSAAEAAALRLQAAHSRLAGSSNAATVAVQQVGAAEIRTALASDRASNSLAGYVRQLIGFNRSATGAVAANQTVANSMDTVVKATRESSRAGRQAAALNANIIAQINDIGVSLAGGQNPLLVAVQQGSQLAYIAGQMDGGFKALFATIVRMLAPFAAIAAAIGVVAVQFTLFNDQVAKSSKGELEAYANTLGLTDKEMRKLANSSVDASGKLKSFDTITVTMGDTWKGFVTTVRESLDWMGPYFEKTAAFISQAWDGAMKVIGFVIKASIAQWVGGFRALVTILTNLPEIAGNSAKAMANLVIGAVEFMLNKAISGVNALITGANPLLEKFGMQVGTIGEVAFERFEVSGRTALGVLTTEIKKAFDDADKFGNNFAARWRANTIQAAKDRIKGAADAIISNRNPSTGADAEAKAAERRAHAIAMVNLALDNELSRMKLLKDERAVAQRMDQIEQSLAQKKIQLNDQERASIEGKVRAIEAYKYVQAEVDRIYEATNGPLRTYNAALQASAELLAQGKLDLSQYNAELMKASDAYRQATDPLFEFNRQIESQQRLLGVYGDALEQATYLEQIRQEYQRRGLSVYDATTGKLREEVAAILAKNQALRDGQFVQTTLAGVLDPLLEARKEIETKQFVYAELERLRQEDLIKQGEYVSALAALDMRYNQMRLEGTADLFGALASVTSKGTGAIAAISKAAAIAQATIQGYVAIQNAIAAPPGFPYNAASVAAAAIKTGANIAGIVSTSVGGFATGGQFMVEGRSGIDANNINMDVTRGERVTVETPAQQRANDAASGQPAQVNVPVRVVAQFDPRMALDALDTSAGERVVISIVERNPQVFQRLMGSR